jgi:uncharacterized protein (DUF983 family)
MNDDERIAGVIGNVYGCVEGALKSGLWITVNCPKCGYTRIEKGDLGVLEECAECGDPEQKINKPE